MAPLIRITKTNAQNVVSIMDAITSLDREMRTFNKRNSPKTDEERRIFETQHSGSFSFVFEERIIDLTCKTECIWSVINYVSDFYVDGNKVRIEEITSITRNIKNFYGLELQRSTRPKKPDKKTISK